VTGESWRDESTVMYPSHTIASSAQLAITDRSTMTGTDRHVSSVAMRLEPAQLHTLDHRIKSVLEAQTTKWGRPLLNHLIYARVPAIFGAVRAMWSGIASAGLIEESLQAMVNRRVAQLNRCDF
jgi:hypothetical protein